MIQRWTRVIAVQCFKITSLFYIPYDLALLFVNWSRCVSISTLQLRIHKRSWCKEVWNLCLGSTQILWGILFQILAPNPENECFNWFFLKFLMIRKCGVVSPSVETQFLCHKCSKYLILFCWDYLYLRLACLSGCCKMFFFLCRHWPHAAFSLQLRLKNNHEN